MIIFGTSARHKTMEEGEFDCPKCQARRHYALKRARRYFTLYFIPLLPLDTMGEFVECQTCGTAFNVEVLDVKLKVKPKPQTTVEQINQIEDLLATGKPVEYVVRDLVLAGVERPVALRLVDSYLGASKVECPDCALTYADHINICSECGRSLEAHDH